MAIRKTENRLSDGSLAYDVKLTLDGTAPDATRR